MTDPNSRFDSSGTAGATDGEWVVLEDLRQIHLADRAPEAFKERAVATLRERSWPLEPRSPSPSWGGIGEWLARSLEPRLELRWARVGFVLALGLGVALAREFWVNEPRLALMPSAEPSPTKTETAEAEAHASKSLSSKPHPSNPASSASRQPGGGPGHVAEPDCPQYFHPKHTPFDPASTDDDVKRAGVSVHTFEQATRSCGAITRRYLEYVPQAASARSAPVVLILHDGPDRAEGMRKVQTRGRFESLANREGFIAVYANAAPGRDSDLEVPNVGRWRLEDSAAGQVDDEAYLQQVLHDMRRRDVIGESNDVFLVGHAEGAVLALQAASRRPDLYSGVAALMPHQEKGGPPEIKAGARLSRVVFVSLGDEMGTVIHDWALSLGVTHDAIQRARAVQLPDRSVEGSDYLGDAPIALRSRSSRVARVDLASAAPRGAMVRVLFVSPNAGNFVPMPDHDDNPRLVEYFGFRNQDIDAVEEAWSFLRGALGE